MSDDQDNTANTERLNLLKERAKTLGISHSPNIGVDALRAKIDEKLNGKPDADANSNNGNQEPKLSKAEREQALRDSIKREALKLIRVRIANMNPDKAELRGEIITVGNRYTGAIKKFIPFGDATVNGYHIPKIIYDDLRSRRFQHKTTKVVNGQIVLTKVMVPEYNIEVLEPLTLAELKQLAIAQGAAERTGQVED